MHNGIEIGNNQKIDLVNGTGIGGGVNSTLKQHQVLLVKILLVSAVRPFFLWKHNIIGDTSAH